MSTEGVCWCVCALWRDKPECKLKSGGGKNIYPFFAVSWWETAALEFDYFSCSRFALVLWASPGLVFPECLGWASDPSSKTYLPGVGALGIQMRLPLLEFVPLLMSLTPAVTGWWSVPIWYPPPHTHTHTHTHTNMHLPSSEIIRSFCVLYLLCFWLGVGDLPSFVVFLDCRVINHGAFPRVWSSPSLLGLLGWVHYFIGVAGCVVHTGIGVSQFVSEP